MKTKLNINSKFIATMLFTMAMLWLPQICSRVMAQEAYAVFDATTGTLTFKYDNNKPAGAYEMNIGKKDPGWLTHKEAVNRVVFDASFAQARPTSCYAWFSSFYNLTRITGLKNLNTEKVETMCCMFNGCTKLTSLDLSTFNTQNVKDMSDMFDYCIQLTSLNLDNFNTQNVEKMYQMFVNCKKIQKLNLYSFDTSKVKSMASMFNNCSALKTIIVSEKFVTKAVTSASNMFGSCKELNGANKYQPGKNGIEYANYTTGYFTPKKQISFAKYNTTDKSLTFYYDYNTNMTETSYEMNEGTTKPGWNKHSSSVKSVVFDKSFAVVRPTSCYYWFSSFMNLTNINGIEYLNTEDVENMAFMFNNCSKIQPLNLTNFNTAKVKNMSSMFENCTALRRIIVSNKFVTTSVTESTNMFYNSKRLNGATKYDYKNYDKTMANYTKGYFSLKKQIGIAKYDDTDKSLTFYYDYNTNMTTNAYELNEGDANPDWLSINNQNSIKSVTFDASFAVVRPKSCYSWFDLFENLTSITGIENLNTENVTNMHSMFKGCSSLKSLDVSHFDTKNVEDMAYMFDNCQGLTELNVSKFDTQKVEAMNYMFNECINISSLDVSNFNTEKVNNMNSMFAGCIKLSQLNLSSFDTQDVIKMMRMFCNCNALKTIFVSDKFVTTSVSYGTDMFKFCRPLKGYVKYKNGNDGIEYANYQTGYFTKYIGTLGEEIIGAAGETLEADNLDLTGDKDFAITESFVAKTATYDRNTTATWGTLCLPFEVTLTDKNFRAFTLLSATADVVELKEVETSIAAGTPVIIKMSDNATNLNIVETGKEIKTAAMVGSSTSDGNYKLVGLYTKKMFDETDNNCFILKNDKLMNPAKILLGTTTKAVGAKAFRAYMEGNSSESGAKIFSLDISDSTTAIDNLNALADSKAEYYNMQGHRLNNLQKGINIVKRNGKTMKVIIK